MKFVRFDDICIEISQINYIKTENLEWGGNGKYSIEICVKTDPQNTISIEFSNKKVRDSTFNKLCEKLENYTV